MSIKSELSKTVSHLRRARQSIIGRGGEISLTAGLKDLPEAIFNIPADASLAHYTDPEIAYRKSVPVGAEKYALLKSIGGMTYKSNNLLPFPYLRMNGTENGVNFSTTDDGAISLNGTSNFTSVSNIALINSSAPITFEAGTYTFRQNRSNNDGNAYMVWAAKEDGANTQYLYEDVVKTFSKKFTLWCAIQIKGNATVNTVLRPMFYKGTATLPYERYYEGLRDSKVTEIKSHGANASPISTPQSGLFSLTSGAETSSSNYIRFYVLSVEPNTTYTLSSNLSFLSVWDDDGANPVKVLIAATDNDYTVTVTTGNSAKRLRVTVRNTSGLADTSAFEWFKINHGTSVAPDAPSRNPISKPIPKALQDIDGYGRGINADCYSYADWGEKQFVNRVGVAVFDGSTDERWYTTPSLDKTDYKAYYISQYAANGHKTSGGVAICDKLSILTTTELYQSNIGGFCMGNVADKQIVIRVPNSIADVSALRTWLSQNPLTFIYELAEPIITDVSDILNDDNFIEVESGGTLEFANEHKNAVPSTVKYTIKVGS